MAKDKGDSKVKSSPDKTYYREEGKEWPYIHIVHDNLLQSLHIYRQIHNSPYEMFVFFNCSGGGHLRHLSISSKNFEFWTSLIWILCQIAITYAWSLILFFVDTWRLGRQVCERSVLNLCWFDSRHFIPKHLSVVGLHIRGRGQPTLKGILWMSKYRSSPSY